eukprot:PhM_4_TR10499/c0_g1_i1/m.88697
MMAPTVAGVIVASAFDARASASLRAHSNCTTLCATFETRLEMAPMRCRSKTASADSVVPGGDTFAVDLGMPATRLLVTSCIRVSTSVETDDTFFFAVVSSRPCVVIVALSVASVSRVSAVVSADDRVVSSRSALTLLVSSADVIDVFLVERSVATAVPTTAVSSSRTAVALEGSSWSMRPAEPAIKMALFGSVVARLAASLTMPARETLAECGATTKVITATSTCTSALSVKNAKTLIVPLGMEVDTYVMFVLLERIRMARLCANVVEPSVIIYSSLCTPRPCVKKAVPPVTLILNVVARDTPPLGGDTASP